MFDRRNFHRRNFDRRMTNARKNRANVTLRFLVIQLGLLSSLVWLVLAILSSIN